MAKRKIIKEKKHASKNINKKIKEKKHSSKNINKKIKEKKHASKNINKKIKGPKRKPRIISVNSKPSATKKNVQKPRGKPSGTKASTRISADTKFWQSRKRRTKNAAKKSVYSAKSICTGRKSDFFPNVGTKFSIKKKMKMTEPLSVTNKIDRNKIKSETNKYLKIKTEKAVYIKAVLRQSDGGIRFVSHKRIKAKNDNDLNDIWNELFRRIGQLYGGADIIGYEIEQVTDIQD